MLRSDKTVKIVLNSFCSVVQKYFFHCQKRILPSFQIMLIPINGGKFEWGGAMDSLDHMDYCGLSFHRAFPSILLGHYTAAAAKFCDQ